MPKVSENLSASTARRRSSRSQIKSSKGNPNKEDEVSIPAGYNPSDDSEEEYIPVTRNNNKSKIVRKRKADDGGYGSKSIEEIDKTPSKRSRAKKQSFSTPSRSLKKVDTTVGGVMSDHVAKKSVSTPGRRSTPSTASKNAKLEPKKTTEVKVKDELGSASGMIDSNTCVCPFLNCHEKLKIDGNCRFHLSLHYYNENKFSTLAILKPEDADEHGKPRDEKGLKVKYTCQHPGCTKRKMGYKEMCVHMATHHQELQKLMENDSSPEVKEILFVLYPSEVKSPVKIKKEVIVPQPQEENDNSEDEDDPTDSAPARSEKNGPKPQKNVQTPKSKVPQRNIVQKPTTISTYDQRSKPKVDKIMNCIICKNKDGKNLNTGTSELKYHLSVCVYGTGGFLKYLPHGQACGPEGGLTDLEEYGNKYKYKCPFENCDKSTAKAKPIGYKEFSIHAGVMHGILERWARDTDREGTKELYELLKSQREEEGIALVEVPKIPFEELHICLICNGQDKEGKNLSFSKEKIYQTRYHYSACIYDSGFYLEMYPPGKQNETEDGKPRDVLGREVKYSCQEKGCNLKRKMGYKEFTIHMSNDHGGLEEVLKNYDDERIKEIAPKLKVVKK